MKQLYPIVCYACFACVLSSCSSNGDYHSSLYLNGMAAPTMNLRDPHFYMDEHEIAPVLANPGRDAHAQDLPCTEACGSRR
jgi:hypothetical protein